MKDLIGYRCEYCKRKFAARHAPDAVVWLELNNETGVYCESGSVPPAQSQGCFPFHSGCAKRELARKPIR